MNRNEALPPRSLEPIRKAGQEDVWHFALCAILFLGVAAMLFPTIHFGLVSDDFYLIAERDSLGAFRTIDFMHRPLRNVLYFSMYNTFGIAPEPYRIWMIGIFGLLLWQSYKLLRDLDVGALPAILAVSVYAFLPRQGEIVFWLAGSQDIAVCLFTVLTARAVFAYRRSPGAPFLLAAAAAYALALGFKETAGLIPVLVWLLEALRRGNIGGMARLSFLTPYLAMAPVAVGFVVYYAAGTAVLSGAGNYSQAGYGFKGVSLTAAAMLKYVLLLMHPAASSFSLSNPHLPDAIIMGAVAVAFVAAILYFSAVRSALYCMAWIVLSILPTSFLAPYYITDRYLSLALIGQLILFGILLNHFFIQVRSTRLRTTVTVAALVLAALLGTRLLHIRSLWRDASQVTETVLHQIRSTMPPKDVKAALFVVGLPHSERNWSGNIAYQLNNGLKGALIGSGYPSSLNVVYSCPTNQQALNLSAEFASCPAADSENHSGVAILHYADGRVRNVTNSCAYGKAVESMRHQRQLWFGDVKASRQLLGIGD